MNRLIIMTLCALGSVIAFGETEIKYYPMNKDTHQYVGFKVDSNGSALENINGTNVVTQINKQTSNENASMYTKAELHKMFSALLEEPDFAPYMDSKFEFWYVDNSNGVVTIHSKKWSELK